MGKFVYLLIDSISGDVVAIYDNKNLAETLKSSIEEKFGCTIRIDERSVNLPIDVIGLFK